MNAYVCIEKKVILQDDIFDDNKKSVTPKI